MLAGESLEAIKDRFAAEYPQGRAAVYMRHESEGRLHCEVIVYFPPETAALARHFGATPCSEPGPASLGILIQNQP